MWNGSYWASRYFAPRYWSKLGAEPFTGDFVRRKANWRNASRSTWRF